MLIKLNIQHILSIVNDYFLQCAITTFTGCVPPPLLTFKQGFVTTSQTELRCWEVNIRTTHGSDALIGLHIALRHTNNDTLRWTHTSCKAPATLWSGLDCQNLEKLIEWSVFVREIAIHHDVVSYTCYTLVLCCTWLCWGNADRQSLKFAFLIDIVCILFQFYADMTSIPAHNINNLRCHQNLHKRLLGKCNTDYLTPKPFLQYLINVDMWVRTFHFIGEGMTQSQLSGSLTFMALNWKPWMHSSCGTHTDNPPGVSPTTWAGLMGCCCLHLCASKCVLCVFVGLCFICCGLTQHCDPW